MKTASSCESAAISMAARKLVLLGGPPVRRAPLPYGHQTIEPRRPRRGRRHPRGGLDHARSNGRALRAPAGRAGGGEARGGRNERQGRASLRVLGRETRARRRGDRWYLFVVRLRLERLAADRDLIVKSLRAENIGVTVHYPLVYRIFSIETWSATATASAQPLKPSSRGW
jgi:hypothetical protein